MTHSARVKSIGGLLVRAALMESVGWILMAVAVAGFWHKAYPSAELTTGFFVYGLVFGVLIVTGFQKLITGLFPVWEIFHKSQEVVAALHAGLVASGDIKIPSPRTRKIKSMIVYGLFFLACVLLWLKILP